MARLSIRSVLPWRVLNFIQISKNKLAYARLNKGIQERICFSKKNIVFDMGFHGISGGPVAISSIANMLAEHFNVFFISYPESHYNQLLDSKILLVNATEIKNRTVNLFISDENKSPAELASMRQRAPLLLSVHCLNGISTGLTKAQLAQALDQADFIHFVSQIQQDSFLTTKHFKIIPNSCKQVMKKLSNPAIGSVGRLTAEDKGALATVAIGRATGITHIHLWGGKGLPVQGSDVILHPWESDKVKIYNSFDVLVFMSKYETFGLVVIEAMSAGIPCLLSNIDAFQQFKNCPGVILVDPSDITLAATQLKFLMENRTVLKAQIIQYWREHYSEDIILEAMKHYVEEISI